VTDGHLHDGGDKIVVTLNGKTVCNSRALYGGPGHETVEDGVTWKTIAQTTSCGEPIRVRKGDKLRFSASFDFDGHPA